MGGIYSNGGSVYSTSNSNSGGGSGGTGPQGPQGPAGQDAPQVEIQYSLNNLNSWHFPFVSGDLYIRFSTDGGITWGTGSLFVGAKGADGADGQDAPQVLIQYSDDGTSGWSYSYSASNKYMRFSTDGALTWGSAILFQGASGGGNAGFNFTQSVASNTWIINHNLGYYPNVECFSAGGVYMFASIQNLSVNSVQVTFNSPVTGSARLV